MDIKTSLAYRIVELAKATRERQRNYFRNGRTPAALAQSKQAEAELDRAIADFDRLPGATE